MVSVVVDSYWGGTFGIVVLDSVADQRLVFDLAGVELSISSLNIDLHQLRSGVMNEDYLLYAVSPYHLNQLTVNDLG